MIRWKPPVYFDPLRSDVQRSECGAYAILESRGGFGIERASAIAAASDNATDFTTIAEFVSSEPGKAVELAKQRCEDHAQKLRTTTTDRSTGT